MEALESRKRLNPQLQTVVTVADVVTALARHEKALNVYSQLLSDSDI